MKRRIGFCSSLGSAYLEDLEKLLFFNPLQGQALPGIHQSIREYGVPSIFIDGDKLRIRIENLPGAQSIFAVEDATDRPLLAGVMVYSRVDVETIVLLHIAVREEFSRFGNRAEVGLVGKMMAQLRTIARSLKGVNSIHLKYAKGLIFPVDPLQKLGDAP
jgi:hypothetical protein